RREPAGRRVRQDPGSPQAGGEVPGAGTGEEGPAAHLVQPVGTLHVRVQLIAHLPPPPGWVSARPALAAAGFGALGLSRRLSSTARPERCSGSGRGHMAGERRPRPVSRGIVLTVAAAGWVVAGRPGASRPATAPASAR